MFFSRNLDFKVFVGDVVHVGLVVFWGFLVKLMAADGIVSSSVTKLIGSMHGKFTYICHKKINQM